jgi:hypothetical protein
LNSVTRTELQTGSAKGPGQQPAVSAAGFLFCTTPDSIALDANSDSAPPRAAAGSWLLLLS